MAEVDRERLAAQPLAAQQFIVLLTQLRQAIAARRWRAGYLVAKKLELLEKGIFV